MVKKIDVNTGRVAVHSDPMHSTKAVVSAKCVSHSQLLDSDAKLQKAIDSQNLEAIVLCLSAHCDQGSAVIVANARTLRDRLRKSEKKAKRCERQLLQATTQQATLAIGIDHVSVLAEGVAIMQTTTEQGHKKQLLQNTVSCNHSAVSLAVSDEPPDVSAHHDEVAPHAQVHQLFEMYATSGHLNTANYALLARSIVIAMPQESRTEEDIMHIMHRYSLTTVSAITRAELVTVLLYSLSCHYS